MASTTRSTTKTSATDGKRSGYIEIPLPKFSVKNFSPNTVNLALFAILLVASYLLGMLTTKVQYLEKGGSTTTQTAQVAAPETTTDPAAAATIPPEEVRKIVEADTGNFPVLGNKDAKVKIVEYSDFQCPFCKQFFTTAYAEIKKDYVDTGKVSYVFKHYPLGFHANAQKAGEAAECVNELNSEKSWDYHDVLFTQQTEWENQAAADAATSFATYATDMGVDGTAFTTCLDEGRFAKVITDDQAEGAKAGVNATPSLFINGVPVIGAQPYASFKTVIDEALKG